MFRLISSKSAFNTRKYSSSTNQYIGKYPHIYIKPKYESLVKRNRHPWIFGSSLNVKGLSLAPGSIIDVTNSNGEFICRGFYNEQSRMAVRVLTWDKNDEIDVSFFETRLKNSFNKRFNFPGFNQSETNSFRLVNAESDLLPGLIIDKYSDWFVVQIQSLGIENHKNEIQQILIDVLKPNGGIYERSDDKNRMKEGLSFRKSLWYSKNQMKTPEKVEILENRRKFLVDIEKGHKTGFYLDQRDARNIVGSVSHGRTVLNCFSYTGGFAVAALQNEAKSVINIDSSKSALEMAEANIKLNGYDDRKVEYIEGNVFEVLRQMNDQKSEFDLIILDPPKFSATSDDVQSASRGYKDINRLAMQLLKKGGILATFSCSAAINTTLFQQIVFAASRDANRDFQIVHTFSQPFDHPVSILFPEGAYLKGFLLQAN